MDTGNREMAERIVAERIEDWGWGELDRIEGLAEHELAVVAVMAGLEASQLSGVVGAAQRSSTFQQDPRIHARDGECVCGAKSCPQCGVVGERELLDDLQQAEFEYRLMHDRHGDGSQAAGRAWDLMRRAGDKARAALNNTGGQSEQEGPSV